MEIMTSAQLTAFNIFCDGATAENDYKPTPFVKIAEKLKEEGLSGSSSAIQRWSKKFMWQEQLDQQLQLIVLEDDDKSTEQKALSRVVEKRLVDINRNNALTADCYEIMELFVKQTADNYDKNGVIKRDDVKIVKDIAVLTGGREDKLLDRIAQSGGEKLSSEDLKKEFELIDMDIEED
jgi:hypothetical protein